LMSPLKKPWAQQPLLPAAEGDPQRDLVRTVLNAAQPAHDVVVRVAHTERFRNIDLRDRRKRIAAAQAVAANPAVLPPEHRHPRAPARTQPETTAENEHRVHVNARRTPEILLHQQARTEVQPSAQAEQRT